VIDRVDHALVANKDSGLPEVAAANYHASFDGQGLRFSPSQPASTPGANPAPDPATEIQLSTVSVQRDGESFYSAASDAAEWSAVGNTAQALLSKDWGVVEHFEAQNDGVAVAWVFPQALPGSGPVDVSMSVDGLSYAGQTDGGFHFADANGVSRVSVSQAFAVDSAGNRWQLAIQPASGNSGQLVVELPAQVQARAVYPLAIDPIVGAEFGMDNPVSVPASGSQANPAVAFVSGTRTTKAAFLVVWKDSRDATDTGSDIYGARVSTNGVVQDPFGIAISKSLGNQTAPSVAAIGTTFLVAWDDQRLAGNDTIFGARVTSLGVVEDPQGIALSTSTSGEFTPTVAAGATNFLVAWEDGRNSGVSGADIYGTRVSPAGVVLDPAGIAISTAPSDQLTPTAVGGTNGYFVAWADNRNSGTTSSDIYGARVSNAGVLLDSNGVAITTAHSTQDEPAMAANGGTVLVVWHDRRQSGSTSDDIFGSRVNFTNNSANVLDLGGIPISTNSSSQKYPAVCALTNEFLVVWRDHRNFGQDSDDIYGTRVDTNGVVLDSNINGFAICTNSASQTTPAVASAPGGALVVWSDARNPYTGNEIYGTRISNAGVVLDTTNVAISLSGAVETSPTVAFNGTNYLVAWADYRNVTVSGIDIRGTRVSTKGTVQDVAGINICTNAADQQHPSAASSGGEFLVAWEDSRNANTTGVDIYGTRINGAGTVLDPSGLAISTAPNDEAQPVVGGNATTFYVAWQDNRNNSTAPDIFGTPVSQGGAIGTPSGTPITQLNANEVDPAIAASATQFLVAWDDGSDVFAARVLNNGTVLDPSGSSIQLANNGNELFPSVAALGSNFLVAWQDSRNSTSAIFAGRVLPDGSTPDFGGFPVCTLPDNQSSPAVGASANNWLIVWQNSGMTDGNDLYCARVAPNGAVQDYLSVPSLGTADRSSPTLAFGNGQFLLVSDAFRSSSDRVVGSLMTADPPAASSFVQFSSLNFSVMESGKFAKVTITLSAKFTGEVTVDFSTGDGTAVAGRDYMPVADRLVFTAKQTSATVLIPIIDDLQPEANKTIMLYLQNPMGGATLGPNNTATLTIAE
jgi:hypothetical protein